MCVFCVCNGFRYARLGDWERFKVFFGEAHDVYSRIPTSSESVSGAAMLLECTALLFRRDLSERNSRRRLTLIRAHKVCQISYLL